MSNAAVTPLVLTPSSETAAGGSLDAALAQLQSPPFEAPVVLDLSGCADMSRSQLTGVFDVLRWRTVWSAAVAGRCDPAVATGHPLAVRLR